MDNICGPRPSGVQPLLPGGEVDGERLRELVRETIEWYGTERGERTFLALMEMAYACAYRFARRRVGQAHVAEEVVKESVTAAYQKLRTFNARRPFMPWFLRIVHNRVIDYLRRETGRGRTPRRFETFDPERHEVMAEHHDPDLWIDYMQWRDTLPHEAQRLLRCREEGLPVAAIAGILGRSERFVYKRLRELARQLRSRL